MSRILKHSVVVATAGGLVALSAPAALAAPTTPVSHQVSVVGNGSTVTVSSPTVAGSTVTLKTSSTKAATADGGGSELIMFRLQNGATLQKVYADFAEEFSSTPAKAAKGTRDLTHDAVFTGLADPVKGHPITVSEQLVPGTYYLVDANAAGVPKATTLTVTKGSGGAGLGKPDVTVQTTSADTFKAPTTWPAKGVVEFDNVSDTLHFMDMTPVKAGTTDKQIQAYFDSGSTKPPAFLRKGRSYDLEVLSPGNIELGSYDLPPGTYVLLCFVADKKTGMPHALMGMHEVVQLG